MANKAEPVRASDIRALLNLRYAAPEWFIQHEVTMNQRRIDALAINCWGGYGRQWRVHGLEIKVSRSDWLRELGNPHKHQTWHEVVDQFIVVAPAGVVLREELPEGWGLMETNGRTLRIKVHPMAATPADTLPREVVGRLLTCAREEAEALVRRHDGEQRRALEAEIRAQVATEQARTDERLAEKAAQWDQLCAATGMAYRSPVDAVVKAAALVEAFKSLPGAWPYKRLVEDLRNFHERMGRVLQEGGPALEAFRQFVEAKDHNPTTKE